METNSSILARVRERAFNIKGVVKETGGDEAEKEDSGRRNVSRHPSDDPSFNI